MHCVYKLHAISFIKKTHSILVYTEFCTETFTSWSNFMLCLIGLCFECFCTLRVDIFWSEFVRFSCNQNLKTFQYEIQSKIIFGCARTKTMKGIWYIFLYIFSCTNQKHISRHAYSEVGPCVLQSTKDYWLFPTYETNLFYLSIPS